MNEKTIENQLCEVGEILYRVKTYDIIPVKITRIEKMQLGHYVYEDSLSNRFFSRHIGKNIFKTETEAQKMLERKKKISEKRKLLIEYEKKLNDELGIKFHTIIK